MIRELFVAGLFLAAHDSSCGDPDKSTGGANAPCTRDRDCDHGLTCQKGVCVDPNAPDAGDAGDAAGDVTDGGG